jgi:hypothetical protein
MIVFMGFPYIPVMDTDIKVDFTIEIMQDYQKSYTKEFTNQTCDEDLLMSIREIRAFLNINQNDNDIHMCNLIEFLIWFDKKTNKNFTYEITSMIHECISISAKIDYLTLAIRHKDDFESYNLTYLINMFWEEDISKYNDPLLITYLREMCELYEINFKNNIINVLKRYVNDKIIHIINDNFIELQDDDIIHIINYSKNIGEIKKEYKRMCIIKDIVEELINNEIE